MLTDTYRNGSTPNPSSTDTYHNGLKQVNDKYKGKVIVIVNSNTQSRGEFWAMVFQSSPNVKVTGSNSWRRWKRDRNRPSWGNSFTHFSGLELCILIIPQVRDWRKNRS